MIDEYLTTKFKGQGIVKLVEFLYDLDPNYDWKGGVINDGLPFEYPDNIEYVIIYEANLKVAVLVKCQVIFKDSITQFVVPLMNELSSNFDMIVEIVGGMNYKDGSISLDELAKQLHGTTIH